jgi:hypothetical protein
LDESGQGGQDKNAAKNPIHENGVIILIASDEIKPWSADVPAPGKASEKIGVMVRTTSSTLSRAVPIV